MHEVAVAMLGSGARLVPGFVMKGDAIAGRYRVDRVLGTGGSGFVVAARHIHSREKVALKVLTNGAAPPSVGVPASPNIAAVIDTGYTQERQGFIASELLEGRSLADVMNDGPMSPCLAAQLIRQACAGLAVAHAVGIVHGDLKPQNLFLTGDGVVKILDFGMTMPLVEETDQEASAAWLQSPAYLAPEQLREPTAGPQADVWALGVILHQLIAGSLPFDAETIAGMFVAVAYDEPRMLTGADVPFELSRVVKACLAKQPAERPNVNELFERLAPFAPMDSVAAQLAMTIGDDPSLDAPLDSIDVREPSPVSRMKAAFERTMSGPPPLPRSRLGAMPRLPSFAPEMERISREIRRRFGRGWLAARLLAQSIAPEAHTPTERSFQRRRWGAVGVVAAAGLLGLASLFASPEPTAAAATATEVASEAVQVADAPLDFGLGAFVPPSFALRLKDDSETQSDRASTPPAALPVRWTPPRTRLLVRDDPYRAAKQPVIGFTHPRRLPDRRR